MNSAFRIPRTRQTDALRLVIPSAAFLIMMTVAVVLEPRVLTYIGAQLLLRFALPLMFASMAQLAIIAASDIDFGIGPFIGLVNCVTAAYMSSRPILCALCLIGCVMVYAAMGAFIQLRRLPSIVVTLGASFVWLGLALMIMPSPGGSAPEWLSAAVRLRPPFLPLPIVTAIVLGAVAHWLFKRSSYSVVLRGLGSASPSVENAGWSLVAARSALYGLAGLFGVASGVILTGLISSGDANIGTPYTLLSVAAVIVGGAEFAGGIVSPIGAIIGAFVMLLTGVLLSFLNVSPDWQLSVQGTLLILVLAARLLQRRRTI